MTTTTLGFAVLGTPIEALALPMGTYNSLKRSQVNTVGRLLELTVTEVESLRNVGSVRRQHIEAALAARGLVLGMVHPTPPAVPPKPELAEVVERFAQVTGELIRALQSVASPPPSAPESTDGLDILARPISALELQPSFAATLGRFATIGQLVQYTPKDLLSLPNLGKVALGAIEAALAEHDLALQPNVPNVPGQSPRPLPAGKRSVLLSDVEIWDLQQLLERVCACNGPVARVQIPDSRFVVHALRGALAEALGDATN
jgi:DNA-directed RNA polymerase alpha subunit